MRLFITLNLPKRERERIHRAARPLRDEELPVRWIEPEHYHLTLKFLGQVRPERIPEIRRTLDHVASATPVFPMAFRGFGAFPTIRRPRVIWLGVEASAELRCLKQDVEWALGDHGFEPETRAFHPHLTLGRADPAIGGGAFRGLDRRMADLHYAGSVTVRSLDLMRSQLSREGARYSVVASSKLARNA